MQRRHAVLARLARKLGVWRYAKLDSHVVANHLIEGMPIENYLRHLANDPNNHPTIRDLAKLAVTGGPKGDSSSVPIALWLLHDALHEHKHPLKDSYSLMSAADKVGLDAHTYRALTEAAENHRRAHPEAQNNVNYDHWLSTPESAAMRVSSEGPSFSHPDLVAEHERFHNRMKQLSPQSSNEDIHESLMRHVERSYRKWRQHLQMGAENVERDLGPEQGVSFLSGHKATRYSRVRDLLARMSRSPRRYEGLTVGEGVPSKHLSGETMYTHPYEGGIARVIPRNEGKTLHVDYVGPENASPGQRDQLNTLGSTHVRGLLRGLKTHYPQAEFITGIRPSGRRAMRPMARVIRPAKDGIHEKNSLVRRYKMVETDFLDALRRVRSAQQTSLREGTEKIAAQLGLRPASFVDAIHDSPHGAVPGIAAAVYGGKPEAAHELASWAGLTGNIPGMAVFHFRPGGTDLLHKFRMLGSGFEVRNKLDRFGITSRVMVPHRKGWDILVPDPKRQLAGNVKELADQQHVDLQTSPGFLKTIGSADQATARKTFRNQVVKGEQQATRKSRLRGILLKLARG